MIFITNLTRKKIYVIFQPWLEITASEKQKNVNRPKAEEGNKMLISTLNQALAAIRAMNRNEINVLTAQIEENEALHCADRRKKREVCNSNIILMWDTSRWDMIRYIYNAQEN